jgi:ABC-type transporter Mla subunit MlaD
MPSVKNLIPWILIAIIISAIIIINSMMVLEVLRQGNALADRANELIESINPVVTTLNQAVIEASDAVNIASDVVNETSDIVDNVDGVVDNVGLTSVDVIGAASNAMYDFNQNVNQWGELASDNIEVLTLIPDRMSNVVKTPQNPNSSKTRTAAASTTNSAKTTIDNTASSAPTSIPTRPNTFTIPGQSGGNISYI